MNLPNVSFARRIANSVNHKKFTLIHRKFTFLGSFISMKMTLNRFLNSLIISAMVCICNVSAQTANAQGINATTKTGFSTLAKRLLPSVVSIRVSNANLKNKYAFFKDNNSQIGSGSGFFINNNYVVTNNHVIEIGSDFEIVTSAGKTYKAVLIGRDEETDIAVLKVQSSEIFPALKLADSDKVEIGDWAIAIGSPFGLGNSFSIGVISGRNRDLKTGRFDNFLQTDAAINQGNSGGPLFDEIGNIIGMNTAIVSAEGGGGNVGVGFAVPSNIILRIANDLVKYGYVMRGYAGFKARPTNQSEGMGVIITKVAENGPAKVAGVKPGDKYFQASGINITDPRQLANIIANAKQGSIIRLEGYRGKQRIFANIKVGTPPSMAATNPSGEFATQKASGLSMRISSAVENAKLGIKNAIVISAIDEYSKAYGIFYIGDIIMDIDGIKPNSPANARTLIENAKSKKQIVFIRIKRNSRELYKMLR